VVICAARHQAEESKKRKICDGADSRRHLKSGGGRFEGCSSPRGRVALGEKTVVNRGGGGWGIKIREKYESRPKVKQTG